MSRKRPDPSDDELLGSQEYERAYAKLEDKRPDLDPDTLSELALEKARKEIDDSWDDYEEYLGESNDDPYYKDMEKYDYIQ